MVYSFMMNEVFEPVEVIVHFDHSKINIVKFRRKNIIYKISSFLQKWKLKDGDSIVTHFIVECKEQRLICELSYHHNDCKWELVQYDHLE